MTWRARYENWRVHRIARTVGPIARGEWLIDLCMPTPLAIRIKRAYDIQQGHCHCERCGR